MLCLLLLVLSPRFVQMIATALPARQRDVSASLPAVGLQTVQNVFAPASGAKQEDVIFAAKWTNRTTRTLRSLSSGDTEEHDASIMKEDKEWARSSRWARELVQGVHVRYLERMEGAGDLTGKDAYERLSKGPGKAPGPYDLSKNPGRVMKTGKNSLPVRGEVCSAVVDRIALPREGAKPVRISRISSVIRTLLLNFRTLMLRSDEEMGWNAYNDMNVYSDPVFKVPGELVRLAGRMWRAGMLCFIPIIREAVTLFTVVKKVGPDGSVSQRLVWGLRKSNVRWKRPRRAALGSPIAFSFLEMEEPAVGVQYTASSGDVPEYYDTCEIEEEFVSHMKMEYNEDIDIPPGCNFLGIRVLGMGWSWACVLAQLLLEAVTESAPRILRAFRVSDIMKTPYLEQEGEVCHWGFIDDYAGIVRGNESVKDAERMGKEVADEVREAFIPKGWEVHKETLGEGLTSLGLDFQLVLRRLRGTPALFWLAFLGTDRMLKLPYVHVHAVERVVGIWTWLSLVAKGGLSCFLMIYRWLGQHRERGGTRRLPPMIRAELSSILGVSTFFGQILSARWCTHAYPTDSCPFGGAVLRTVSPVSELREEAQYAEKNGWWSRLEMAGSAALRSLEEPFEHSAQQNLEESASAQERIDDQKFSAGTSQMMEAIATVISDLARKRFDLGRWMKRLGATRGWRLRILWVSKEVCPKADLRQDECFSDMRDLCASGRVAALVALCEDMMILPEPAALA